MTGTALVPLPPVCPAVAPGLALSFGATGPPVWGSAAEADADGVRLIPLGDAADGSLASAVPLFAAASIAC